MLLRATGNFEIPNTLFDGRYTGAIDNRKFCVRRSELQKNKTNFRNSISELGTEIVGQKTASQTVKLPYNDTSRSIRADFRGRDNCFCFFISLEVFYFVSYYYFFSFISCLSRTATALCRHKLRRHSSHKNRTTHALASIQFIIINMFFLFIYAHAHAAIATKSPPQYKYIYYYY